MASENSLRRGEPQFAIRLHDLGMLDGVGREDHAEFHQGGVQLSRARRDRGLGRAGRRLRRGLVACGLGWLVG